MSRFVEFIGRTLFAVLFISAGVQKASQYNFNDGGPAFAPVDAKLHRAVADLERVFSTSIPLEDDVYKYLFGAAIAAELIGAVLFVLGSSFGALILALFLIVVTPIMHPFWNEEGLQQQQDLVQFMKNVSLLGALLVYMGLSSRISAIRSVALKEKTL